MFFKQESYVNTKQIKTDKHTTHKDQRQPFPAHPPSSQAFRTAPQRLDRAGESQYSIRKDGHVSGGLYTGSGSGVGMNIISPPANHRRVSPASGALPRWLASCPL